MSARARLLLVEDFDSMPPPVPALPGGCACARCAARPGPACTAEAHDAGYAAGLAERTALDTAEAVALARTLAQALADADADIAAIAEASAEAVGRAVIAMAVAALPATFATLGAREVRAIAAGVLPALRSEAEVTITAGADALKLLAPVVAGFAGPQQRRIVVLADEAAGPGDVEITWQGGAANRDAGEVLARVRDVLAEFGLLAPAGTQADEPPITARTEELADG